MNILILSFDAEHAVLPGLDYLQHSVRVSTNHPQALSEQPAPDIIIIDARKNLHGAKALGKLISGFSAPSGVLASFSEGSFIGLDPEWRIDDIVVDQASPAEIEARLQRIHTLVQIATSPEESGTIIRIGELVIDVDTYSAKLKGTALDLTYKEFELLRFLAQHPGKVSSRDTLLREVWGYDYYGGTRTVDVHIRRLRAKLGSEHESFIATIRQVGYKFHISPSSRTQKSE